jgi:hypothetical protein
MIRTVGAPILPGAYDRESWKIETVLFPPLVMTSSWWKAAER